MGFTSMKLLGKRWFQKYFFTRNHWRSGLTLANSHESEHKINKPEKKNEKKSSKIYGM